MNGEIWKDIPGTDGAYQATKDGNIRSVDRWIEYSIKNNKIKRIQKGKIIKKTKNNSGYYMVYLGKIKMGRHVAICRTFNKVPDHLKHIPIDKLHVNHINNNRTDNRSINLEFCTARENYWHSRKQGRSDYLTAHKASKKKIRLEYNKNIYFTDSVNEAAKLIGCDSRRISEYINGKKVKLCEGWIVEYVS